MRWPAGDAGARLWSLGAATLVRAPLAPLRSPPHPRAALASGPRRKPCRALAPRTQSATAPQREPHLSLRRASRRLAPCRITEGATARACAHLPHCRQHAQAFVRAACCRALGGCCGPPSGLWHFSGNTYGSPPRSARSRATTPGRPRQSATPTGRRRRSARRTAARRMTTPSCTLPRRARRPRRAPG